MRLKQCKKCGGIFKAISKDVYMCPSCHTEIKRGSVLRERTCRRCEASFTGGPRAWYCPRCRKERKKEQKQNQGETVRPLGSTDVCQICGNKYIVNSSRQKYCPDCATEATKEVVRIHKRKYMEANKEVMVLHKKEMRENGWVCVVCGKVFDKDTPTVTCSPKCAKIREKSRKNKNNIQDGGK